MSVFGLKRKAPLLSVVIVTVGLVPGLGVGVAVGLGAGVAVGVCDGVAVEVEPVKVGDAVGEELPEPITGEPTDEVGVTAECVPFVPRSQAVTSSRKPNNKR